MEKTFDYDFIRGLPKAELHLHLEGTLEPDLKLKLAKKNNIDIGQSTIEEVEQSYQFDSLTSFLQVYYPAMNVLQDESDFYDLATCYLKKAAENNVKYAELFFDPQAHTTRGVAFETLFNGYYNATQDAKSSGVEANLIMCFLRDMSAESAMETYKQALPFKDKILGIGLDSDERNNPPSKFKEVFELAKNDGFKVTMHCDIDQVGSINNIEYVLKEIKANRIDHGTNIVENATLVDYANKNGIGFTCCPVSNSFVTDDMKGKEILELLHKGVKVTINSDDPAYFKSYISDDMFSFAQKMNATKDDMIKLAKNSFEIAWISDDKRQDYIKMIDDYILEN